MKSIWRNYLAICSYKYFLNFFLLFWQRQTKIILNLFLNLNILFMKRNEGSKKSFRTLAEGRSEDIYIYCIIMKTLVQMCYIKHFLHFIIIIKLFWLFYFKVTHILHMWLLLFCLTVFVRLPIFSLSCPAILPYCLWRKVKYDLRVKEWS